LSKSASQLSSPVETHFVRMLLDVARQQRVQPHRTVAGQQA
jgi:hypothetical protein